MSKLYIQKFIIIFFIKISINKCVWTYNDQKCLEGLRNWRTRNLNLYDDFRPLFDKLPELELQNKSLEKQNFFNFLRGKQNTNDSLYIASILLSRTISYCSSTEMISSFF